MGYGKAKVIPAADSKRGDGRCPQHHTCSMLGATTFAISTHCWKFRDANMCLHVLSSFSRWFSMFVFLFTLLSMYLFLSFPKGFWITHDDRWVKKWPGWCGSLGAMPSTRWAVMSWLLDAQHLLEIRISFLNPLAEPRGWTGRTYHERRSPCF